MNIDDLAYQHFTGAFWASFVVCIVLVVMLMEFLRYMSSMQVTKVIPASLTNETVQVMVPTMPIWMTRIVLVVITILAILLLRNALGLAHIGFKTQDGALSTVEALLCLSFTDITYFIAGPVIAKKLTLSLLKKFKFAGQQLISDDDYLKLSAVTDPEKAKELITGMVDTSAGTKPPTQ